MARCRHHNILKVHKTKLRVHVRKAFPYDYRPPCPSTCSASPLHITFHTQFEQRFLEPQGVALSDSSSNIGECLDEKTVCLDGGLIFEDQEEKNSHAVVETVLGSLGVKKSQCDRVFKDVMAFGRRYNNAGKENKGLRGLVVILRSVQTCVGEKVAVHEAIEKSYQESKAQARRKDDILFLTIENLGSS